MLETFFDAAIEDAKRVDQYFVQNKKPVGPLHGLPVSLKDQFHVKGVETSMGYVGKNIKLYPAPLVCNKSTDRLDWYFPRQKGYRARESL